MSFKYKWYEQFIPHDNHKVPFQSGTLTLYHGIDNMGMLHVSEACVNTWQFWLITAVG